MQKDGRREVKRLLRRCCRLSICLCLVPLLRTGYASVSVGSAALMTRTITHLKTVFPPQRHRLNLWDLPLQAIITGRDYQERVYPWTRFPQPASFLPQMLRCSPQTTLSPWASMFFMSSTSDPYDSIAHCPGFDRSASTPKQRGD